MNMNIRMGRYIKWRGNMPQIPPYPRAKLTARECGRLFRSGGLPHVTMSRYFAQHGYFETCKRAGALPVFSRDDEKTTVDIILQHTERGMCLNHAQVRQKVENVDIMLAHRLQC
jgi:hypothetical protein